MDNLISNFDPSTFNSSTIIGGNSERIIGGSVVKPRGKYKFIGALGSNDEIFCGGTLLSNKWFLTAAHCFDELEESYDVYRNLHDKREIGINNDIVRYSVEEIHIHPDYNIKTKHNDIALLELESRGFEIREKSVYLDCSYDSLEEDDYETFYTVMGWGLTAVGGETSNLLMELSVPIYDFDTCKVNYRKPKTSIINTQFCAGYTNGKKDSCEGDSGGPLVQMIKSNSKRDSSRFKQVGIVSFGISCAKANYPGVYTKVNQFIDWIKETTLNNWCN